MTNFQFNLLSGDLNPEFLNNVPAFNLNFQGRRGWQDQIKNKLPKYIGFFYWIHCLFKFFFIWERGSKVILKSGFMSPTYATLTHFFSDWSLVSDQAKANAHKSFSFFPSFIFPDCVDWVGYWDCTLLVKVRTFWKGHKMLKQSPTWFDIY